MDHGVPDALARSRIGLTLIELLVAIAVAALLAAIAIPQYIGSRERAEAMKVIVKMHSIGTALDRYRIELGQLPNELSDAVNPVPEDPWGNAYQYLNLNSEEPGVKGKRRKDKNLVPINSDYDLYSMGPDGQSKAPLTAKHSRDDIIRANNGAYFGPAEDY